jgi:hypothetical protein
LENTHFPVAACPSGQFIGKLRPLLRIRNDRDNQTLLPDARFYVLFTKLDDFFTLHLLHCRRPRESVPHYLLEPPLGHHQRMLPAADLRSGVTPRLRHVAEIDGSNADKNPDSN